MKYLTPIFSGERSLPALKNLEWIFIGIHSIGVPVILVMAWLHRPDSFTSMAVIAVLLFAYNVIAGFLNYSIRSVAGQQRLSMLTLIVLGVFAWVLIFYLLDDPNTSAYAGFFVILIEGAGRFGLIGSMLMGVVFVIGFSIAMVFREAEYDLEFNLPGYVFWTVIMMFTAFTMGLIAEETRRERRRNVLLVKERTIATERSRIARDLHDTVLKTLHGLALEAHALRKRLPPHGAERVEYIEGVCRRSSQEIRDVIYELRGEEEEEGIGTQISRMLKAWGEDTGMNIKFSISGSDLSLPLMVTHNIRGVLSEALLNIHKHASASRVNVSVEIIHGEMRLEIEDDGRGIDCWDGDLYAIAHDGKFGILGMKERVEQLNGQFSIDSGKGTRLLILIPLLLEGVVNE